ncbi:SHD1 domain-containing protein [Bremerella sp.]|uniref:SHD1 domain-containing protein n=1 Tax=Bremerella sp. TaxID=2795602 RepID=UPI00391B2AD9
MMPACSFSHRHALMVAVCGMLFPLLAYGGEPTGGLAKYAENRNWVDGTGKFQIGGTLKNADEKEIQILKADGRVVTVPLDKLSEKDQQYIQEFLKAEAAQNDPNNPFAGGEPENPFAGGQPAAAMPAANNNAGGGLPSIGKLNKVNVAAGGARPLNLAPGREFWSVQPPVALPEIKLQDTILTVPLDKPFFGKMSMAVAGRAPTVVVNVYQEGRKPTDNYGRFILVEPSTQKTSAVAEFEQPYRVVAIAPNAAMFAAIRVEGWDTGNDLALFSIEGQTITPMYEFTVGGGQWKEFTSATFLPNNRLAVITKDKKLTFWDLSGSVPRAVQQGELPQSLHVSFSPAAELMAFPAKKYVGFLDTNSGNIVGSIAPESDVQRTALSADGKRVAVKLWDKLVIYSMEDGSHIKSIPIAETGDADLAWVGAYVKLKDTIYDVERGLPLWTYNIGGSAKELYNNQVFACFGDKQSSQLTVTTLPHDTALRSAETVDPKTLYAMSPGSAVRVNYSFSNVSDAEQRQIQDAVTAKLKESGWVNDNSASVVLEVSVKEGEQREEEYYTEKSRTLGGMVLPPIPRPFGARPTGPTEKVKFRPWIHSFELKSGNDVLFKNEYTRGAPSSFRTDDDESIQSAVLKHIHPDPKWFSGIKMPSYIVKSTIKDGLGKSNLTASGLN